ncbi:MAG: hypothetical protein ACMXYF_03640 [Candidatus Woesearchaeota archaeon]
MKKRSQVSVFLIIGLILLLALSLLYSLSSLSLIETERERTQLSDAPLFPVESHVNFCANQAFIQATQSISITASQYRDSVPYLFTQVDGQQIVKKQDIAQQLSQNVTFFFQDCFSAQAYEELGYHVEIGTVQTQLEIFSRSTRVDISMPFFLESVNQTIRRDSFTVLIETPLGQMIELISTIINHELEFGMFDQVRYMHSSENILQDQPLVIIEKTKPYPDIIYSLYTNYRQQNSTLTFALQGVDAFDRVQMIIDESAFRPQGFSGCCSLQDSCYQSVSQDVCEQASGEFSSQCQCVQENINQESLSITSLQSCNGVQSGNSWCSKTGIGVGSRYYREMCVDGQIIREECRDFRQEVCAQDITPEITYTACKPNTALSCQACQEQSCCTDECQWVDGTCVGAVSLGLPFWDTAFSNAFCQGQTPLSCALSGDCGVLPTITGDFSQPLPSPMYAQRLSTYLHNDELVEFDHLREFTQFQRQPRQSLSQMLAQSIDQLSLLSSYTSDQLLEEPPQTSEQNDLCFVSSPSQESQCDLCQTLYSCSQYVCQSLGQNCQYNVQTQECVLREEQPLRVIDLQTPLGAAQRVQKFETGGFQIERSVDSLLNVTFTTDQPALCRPSYLPYSDFSQISSPDLSQGNYQTNHTLLIRFIEDMPVFSSLQSIFETEQSRDILEQMTQFKDLVDLLINRGQLEKIQFYPALQKIVDDYNNPNRRQSIIDLLTQIEQKQFSAFIYCQSPYSSSTSSFVSFDFEPPCIQSPEMTVRGDVHPFVKEQITIYTDVLSDCRFDTESVPFDQLRYNATCAQTKYEIDDQGLYSCTLGMEDFVNESSLTIGCFPTHIPGPLVVSGVIANVSTQLNYTSSATDVFFEKNQTIEFVKPQEGMVCSVNNQPVDCDQQSCPIEMHYQNQTQVTVVCAHPSDTCRLPLIETMQEFEIQTREPPVLPQDYSQNETHFIFDVPSDVVQCTHRNYLDQIIELDIESGVATLEKNPRDSYIRLVCKDSYGLQSQRLYLVSR